LGLIVLLLPILGPNINKKTNKKRKYKKFDKILEEKKISMKEYTRTPRKLPKTS